MRKPRDYDAELKALNDKAKELQVRKQHQFGELVIATGADALPIDVLAGAMLAAADSKDAATVEGWRKRGAAFFQGTSRGAPRRVDPQPDGAAPNDCGAASA